MSLFPLEITFLIFPLGSGNRMLEVIVVQIIKEIISIFISIPFGLLSLTLGSILYVPTGTKFGKYAIIFGLLILTLNVYIV